MESDKLIEILRLVGVVKSDQWKRVLEIVKWIKADKVKVVEKAWFEPFRNVKPDYYPLDLSDIETWSTYDGDCISLTFYIDNNKLFCDVIIYDGEIMHGYRKNKRFIAKLEFDDSYILTLENRIMYDFQKFAEDRYEDYLERKKENWVNRYKNKIIRPKPTKLSFFSFSLRLFK